MDYYFFLFQTDSPSALNSIIKLITFQMMKILESSFNADVCTCWDWLMLPLNGKLKTQEHSCINDDI